ncbi:hypothetical protein [Corynebacterium lowii]|uniref:CopG family transcriptional regulator n=1 Tax=Corynebacterium lowii TaxID=1544413 RepID=A0A0N8W0L6_9CORY|nr:hypothetical protein [Corynebacterium lowii]KQB87042.1 hypothetical protein Clow_00087 [Corynebacterium lowii]MDP9852376.1 uncharacterized protein (DUF1778 family) [Corynebacterium lowii]
MAMTLRLTAEQDRALSLLSQAQGCSKQEAAVRAILAAAARTLDDAHVTQLARESLNEYLDAERRLRP